MPLPHKLSVRHHLLHHPRETLLNLSSHHSPAVSCRLSAGTVSTAHLDVTAEEELTKEPPTALTKAFEGAYHSTDFSLQDGFYLLSYPGPGMPDPKVVEAADSSLDNILGLHTGGIPITMPTVLSVTPAVRAQQLAMLKAIYR
ncbi:hypothetical protein B0H12DRAFT_1234106 [Mycena haematopus]|nr:hypothetical protein B0H12DRAFT_1234106 [Mycena haematopus]